ncbi:MAG: porin [Pseudomonadales bacterium]|nr:porin [Pseudomonadales bacterium]
MRLRYSTLCFGTLLLSSFAQASDVNFSGFGSITAGVKDHSRDGYSYARYEDTHFSFEPDSLVGLQATTQINDKASASIQLLARGALDWDAEIDWAYLSYQVTDSFTWRAGRIRAPFFLYSDYISVGYAYPWITPPFETYSSPFTSLDGVDFVFRHSFGEVDMLFQGYVGSDSFVVEDTFATIGGIDGEVQNQFGLIAEMTWRDLRLRYAYHAADVELDFSENALGQLADSLEGAGFDSTAARMRYEGDYFDFHEIGLQYDNGNVLLIAEVTTSSAHDEAPAAEGFSYFFTAGYRFNDFLLAGTYSRRDDDKADLSQDMDPTNPAFAIFYPLVEGAAEALVEDVEQYTLTFRWDFSPGIAFKAEVIDLTNNKDPDGDTMITRSGIQFVF